MNQFLSFIFLIFSPGVFSQNFECEKIYEAENLTKEAVFSGSRSQFMKLMIDSVLCDLKPTAHSSPPTRLKAKVTIDSKGRLVDSFIFTEEIEKLDKELINKKLLKMDNWLPAEIDGHKVCSYYFIIIGCIIWN